MQLKTLHQGNKCSWHDCSRLMSFPPNRDWFNLHDIYLFIQSLALWEPRQSSHTYWTYKRIIISPIDCLRFNTCLLGLLAYRAAVVVHAALCAFQTKPASISAGVRTLCMRPNCPGLRPNVHHPTFSLARTLSLIDFPLLCHCGGLFKHTYCDVRPRTARHPKLSAWTSEREGGRVREAALPSSGRLYNLQMCFHISGTAHGHKNHKVTVPDERHFTQQETQDTASKTLCEDVGLLCCFIFI